MMNKIERGQQQLRNFKHRREKSREVGDIVMPPKKDRYSKPNSRSSRGLNGSANKDKSGNSLATRSSSKYENYKRRNWSRNTPILDYAVVLEIGSRYSKLGFAVDGTPRIIVETNFKTNFPIMSSPYPYQELGNKLLSKKTRIIPHEEMYLTKLPLSDETWEMVLHDF
eukprot:UN32758